MHNVHKDTFHYLIHTTVAGPYIYSENFVERAVHNWRKGDSYLQTPKHKAVGIMLASFNKEVFSKPFNRCIFAYQSHTYSHIS